MRSTAFAPLRLAACIAVVVPLAAPPACASPGQSGAPQIRIEVARALDKAAQVASRARQRLAAVSGPEVPLSPIALASVPPALRRPVTVAWTGPADALVRRIAVGIGYSFSESGPRPVVPPIVIMRLDGVPAVSALREVGVRVAREARVVVNPAAQQVEYENSGPRMAYPIYGTAAPPGLVRHPSSPEVR